MDILPVRAFLTSGLASVSDKKELRHNKQGCSSTQRDNGNPDDDDDDDDEANSFWSDSLDLELEFQI